MKQRHTKVWIISIIIVLVLAGGAYAYYHNHQVAVDPYYPKASAAIPSSVTPSPTPYRATTNATPTVTPTPVSNETGSVTITNPTSGGTVTSGTTVSGTAAVTTSKLYFRLKGGKSGQLASGDVNVTPSTTPQAFSFQLAFTNQVAGGSDQGVLEVYQLTSTGAEQDVANLNVMITG